MFELVDYKSDAFELHHSTRRKSDAQNTTRRYSNVNRNSRPLKTRPSLSISTDKFYCSTPLSAVQETTDNSSYPTLSSCKELPTESYPSLYTFNNPNSFTTKKLGRSVSFKIPSDLESNITKLQSPDSFKYGMASYSSLNTSKNDNSLSSIKSPNSMESQSNILNDISQPYK